MTTARCTTARAVSGGAALRSRWVSPTFSPSKERTGSVASWEVMESDLGVVGVKELGLNVNEANLLWGWEEDDERKIEDEKKEKDGVVAEEAIFVG